MARRGDVTRRAANGAGAPRPFASGAAESAREVVTPPEIQRAIQTAAREAAP